jgi:hypothetical protein
MALSTVTGVFSRYFVVGFFLPCFFSLFALWLTVSHGLLPDGFERHSDGTEIIVLGGVALIAALAASGLNYGITRLFEGYPLEAVRRWPLLGRLRGWAIRRQRREYDRLLATRDGADSSEADRGLAAWRLDRRFPADPEKLLPTRFGNAVRAFEGHARSRWGLDGIAIWPRIEMLLSAEERELHTDAKIDVNVFLNAAVGALVVGVVLLVDLALNSPVESALLWAYATPFAIAYLLYLPTRGAAERWGSEVRASVDLHRLELYTRLGLRAPESFSDERKVAKALNQCLLYGIPLPDALHGAAAKSDDAGGRHWTLSLRRTP